MAMSRRRRFFWVAVGLVLVASFTAALLGGVAYFVQNKGASAKSSKSDSRSHVLSISLDGSDNRCAMHRRDPFQGQGRRRMHRLMTKGERPS